MAIDRARLREARDALDRLLALGDDLVDEEVREAVVDAHLVADVATQLRRDLAHLVEVRDAHAAEGACSAASWLAQRCDVRAETARGWLSEGQRFADAPEVLRAAAGTLGAEKVTALLGCVAGAYGEAFELSADTMVAAAARLPVEQVRTMVKRFKAIVDTDGPDPYVRRSVRVRIVGDQVVVTGVLVDVDGLALKRAVEHRARELRACDETLPADERRSWEQLCADALAELVADGAAAPRKGRTRPPRLVVVADHDDLVGGRGTATTVERDHTLSMAAVRQLACGSPLSRLLLTAGSLTLDLGRDVRLATPRQRLALAVRDGGCRFGGCRRPAERCEAHHIDWWEDGGFTDLANLVLLCAYHHHLVHTGRWAIRLRPDGVVVATRTGDGHRLLSHPPPPPGSLPIPA